MLNFREIRTNRLILRKPRIEDAPRILEIIRKPEVHQYLFIDGKSITLEQEQEFIRKHTERMEKPSDEVVWFIEYQNQVVGAVTLKVKDSPNPLKGYFGYMLDSDFWRQGIMSESLHELIKHSFSKEVGLSSLQIGVFAENKASAALAQKVGFTQEGCVRESIMKGKDIHDEIIFTLLKSDL